MMVTSAAFSHPGRRDNNEDAFCALPQLGLYAVADGMGGYEGGEVASRLAIDTLVELIRRDRRDPDATWPCRADPALGRLENGLQMAMQGADRAVAARRTGRLSQMGSTLTVLLLVEDDVAVVGNIGDSRVYRLRDGRLEQLTTDHSLFAEMVRSGTVDPEAQGDFPYGNIITRALGVAGAPDVFGIDLRPDDAFVICSDGLTESVPEPLIGAYLGRPLVDVACPALVHEAFERGSRDNITAVFVRVTSPNGDRAW